MFLSAEEGPPATAGPADGGADEPKGRTRGGARVPNVKGDFDELLSDRPVFRTKLNGYDRLEVDNYTLWAEGELLALRRELDHLLNRFGAVSAELEISRRLLADAPRGRETFPVSERVQEILRLASDEAAAITEAGAREAESLLAEARNEADARLRKAHEIKEMAVSAADEILQHARRERAAAVAAVEQARAEGAEIVRQAEMERDRLAAEGARRSDQLVAEATAQLAGVRAEIDELRQHRDQAREALRGVTDRIGQALQAMAGMVPEDAARTHVVRGNVAMEGPVAGDDPERDGVVDGTSRAAAVPS
jgi:cell division septum initiation protein DivIVA